MLAVYWGVWLTTDRCAGKRSANRCLLFVTASSRSMSNHRQEIRVDFTMPLHSHTTSIPRQMAFEGRELTAGT